MNGILQITFTDGGDLAVVSSNILHFLRDDAVTSGEQTTGFIDYIRIYDTVLGQGDVRALFDGGLPDNLITDPIPEPVTLTLFGLGLLGLGLARRRKRQAA